METQDVIEQTSSKRSIDILAPIKFGFSRTFKNARFWIPFALLNMVIMIIGFGVSFYPLFSSFQETILIEDSAPNIPISTIFGYVITVIILAVLGIMTSRQSIRDVSSVKSDNTTIIEGQTPAGWNTLGKDIAWGKIIATGVLVGLIAGLLGGILGSILGLFVPSIDSGESVNTGMALLVVLLTIMIYIAIFAISILIGYAPYFATDPETNTHLSPIDCIKSSYEVVKDNFWKVFGFNIILAVITSIIVILTAGIGMLVMLPALSLAQSYMFRSLAGLHIPVQE